MTTGQIANGIRPGLYKILTILEYFNMDWGQCGECWHASHFKYLELMLVKLGKHIQAANWKHDLRDSKSDPRMPQYFSSVVLKSTLPNLPS